MQDSYERHLHRACHLTHQQPDSLLPFCEAPQQFLLNLSRSAGPVARFRLHDEAFVLLTDPHECHAVLNEGAGDFAKGELSDLLRPAMGEGIVTAEDDAWRDQHRVLAPLFARRRLCALEPLIT